MNTKAEQNSQKRTEDLNSNNYAKQASEKLMDNILNNMKTHIKKPQQASSNGMSMHHQSKLKPEYLNNILIDINDVDKLKNKQHKVSASPVSTTKKISPATVAGTTPQDGSKNAHKVTHKPVNLVNSILSKTEKRPKSGIKRRLKKLIEYKNKSSADGDEQKTQATSAHSSKQTKATKNDSPNVHEMTKEESSNNVQQISNPEQSIINNTPTSIAESNKRDPKFKKTKKESKKKELKEKNNTCPDLIENDKKTVKCKQKPKAKQKTVSNTSCPQTILTKPSALSPQSKKIKLLVNQIASNLKQTTCLELNTGNIKRDIYIKGFSTCMTSQALEQINRILNPPRIAAYRANLTATKNNNMLVKSNHLQNITLEEISRPTTSQKNRNELSKMNIANEINTFNKPQQQSPLIQQLGSVVPTLCNHHEDNNKTKDSLPIQAAEKENNGTEQKFPIYTAPPMTNQEEELIKKINEKIDKIITSGLSSFEEVDTSTSSLTIDNTNEETKTTAQAQQTPAQPVKPPLPPPPVNPINVRAALAKTKEPARFMQASNLKANNITSTSAKSSPNTTAIKSNREPRASESPPLVQVQAPQTAQAQTQGQPNIPTLLNVVRNTEIINNIKQTTITVIQNAVSKNVGNTQQTSPTEKTYKVIEKKPINVPEPTKPVNKNEQSLGEKTNTTSKTVPLLKQIHMSTENLIRSANNLAQRASNKIGPASNAEKTINKLNAIRKPSKSIGQNFSITNAFTIGNRPTVTTSHLLKNTSNLNSATHGTSSSSTLNLMEALSTNKKFCLLSPMEVVQDFVNLVNHAKRNRKTFTICGNFYSLRRAFAERGWIEKMRINIMEDRETWRKIESLSNFELVDGMRNKEVGEKYRRVFLTKLLAGHQVDFYWDYLTNPFAVNNDKIKRTLINRFPYGATRAYTSKHGLTESLRDAHWYCIDGYANIYYPRTYNLSMIEEMTSFMEDFRITAVISLLQWIVSNMTTPEKILSASGDVPTSVYNFATIQCHNFIKIKEHRDIDEVIPQAKDYEWEVFLEKFYRIVHNENCFKMNERISAELMIEQSKYVLKKVKKYLPNLHLDGFKNMWLLKPNNGSRGCGIHVCRTLKYMMDTVNNRKDIKYVVQKYLERPLLIHKTKFDIRQWFLVTCMPNVKVWLYKECYLRFSSQMFDLNKLHESIHLTNNSVQCRYKNNNQRSTSLPEQNMWDSETFKKYLAEIGQPYVWRNNIYKGMKECLIGLFMLCQSKMELRINSFELCGADFMLSEDYHPYLIEINSRPALYPSTKITARMCPKVLEDVIKVTIDHARNPKASTGDFELIYTDSFNYSIPRNVNNLYIEGMSYFSKFIEKKPSVGLNTNVPLQPVKEVKNDSIKKILNIDPGVVKIDVRNTLEKILAVVHNDSNSKVKESPEERNNKFRSMLSEFVSIISNVKNVNEEV